MTEQQLMEFFEKAFTAEVIELEIDGELSYWGTPDYIPISPKFEKIFNKVLQSA